MNKKSLNGLILICMMLIFGAISLYGQVDQLHGDQSYSTYGVHSGNQIRTSFWNDGQIGYRNPETDEQVRGEWPINSGHMYIAKISSYFGSEVRCEDGVRRAIVSEANGTRAGQPTEHSSGDASENGEYWSMCPLPGFYNSNPPSEEADQAWVAMSHKGWSWPNSWPDKMDDPGDPGWPGFWNGYFGKDETKAADQESYYVMDDYNNIEFPFYPDSTNRNRRGLGLRVTVRGMQWSQALVEDVIFWLFDAENIGTHFHEKMGFGINCGPDIGGDSGDDGGSYDLENDIAYQYDDDKIGRTGWYPVGLLGLAFLETPGNPHDGIDNDGDGASGSGQVLTEDLFQPITVNIDDDIILIDYNTFERSQAKMPAEGVTVTYVGVEYTFLPGELEEVPNNLIDDDLDGLIDENNGRLVGTGADAYLVYLNEGLKYVDYFTGVGSDNPMIDERRDDGIDNNNDWNPLLDDVGLDGVAADPEADPPIEPDEGEGDGVPTSGFGTDRPGEPNIDKTDIDESDQIGLTSFVLFDCCYELWNDEKLWGAVEPGYLDPTFGIGNTDIMMGSAYFTLEPEEIKRVSFALLYGSYTPGEMVGDLIRNKKGAQAAYNANYQFAKAPPPPEVTYIAEDGKVTLYWDDVAETAYDPLTGYDFEGYKIYRSTDPAWNDMAVITNGFGVETSFRQPVAQFDLDNEFTGFSQMSYDGIQFYLGSNNGLAHSWTDTTVVNGQDYYYAVTTYDHGADSLGVFPSECTRYLSINADGSIEKDENVVIVRPEAPSSGFENAEVEVVWKEGSTTTGSIVTTILNNELVEDKTYNIIFEDTLIRDRLWMVPHTKNFSLIDVTDGAQDTLIEKSENFGSVLDIPGTSAVKLLLRNKSAFAFNTDSSGWNNPNIYGVSFKPAYLPTGGKLYVGTWMSHDYRIEFGDLGIATSTEVGDLPAVPVNFRVINSTSGEQIEFFFQERDGTDGMFTGFGEGTNSDRICFLEKDANDSLITTGQFELTRTGATDSTRSPQSGDIMTLVLDKPFLSHDVAEFQTIAAHINEQKAKSDLKKVKVVPNPYIVGNSWEPRNLYSSGRGARELHFIHLPMKCTIRIFNIQGQLVRTLEHRSTIWDGTEIWDMLSKDKLDIAYGVYIYHVEAPGIGEKIGKFAVIK